MRPKAATGSSFIRFIVRRLCSNQRGRPNVSTAANAVGAAPAPRHAVHRASPLTVGTIVFLASECMFFSALFAIYFTLRAINIGPWPPEGVDLPVPRALVFTALLVSSSGTMQMAQRPSWRL